jgi:hypothetical protein
MLHFWRHGSDGRAGGAGRRVLKKAALPGLLEWANDPAAWSASVESRRRFEELQRQGADHLHNLFAVLNCDA